ncbi:hypothetical protein A8144_00610 [Mycobacterium leprae 3125609]|nr:hypothetical protein A8144_00610 [Mycobacterium leprae 3125609]OAX72281.1 hypothetical protein A3216_00675 [Mycobacterium leprae 7935681]
MVQHRPGQDIPSAVLPHSFYEPTPGPFEQQISHLPSSPSCERCWSTTARPGAQRLAVTSVGAIPDRGLFSMYLTSYPDSPSRISDLDEEMVYASPRW